MLPQIPNELFNWLQESHWSVIDCKPIAGGFAASLYQLTIQTETGNILQAIYKHFAAGRAQEYYLYQTILPQLAGYAPTLYARIQLGDKQGILIEHVGRPLKLEIQIATRQDQIKRIRDAAKWLARFHIDYEERGRNWLKKEKLGSYPLDSSLNWGNDAIRELQWLLEQDISLVTQSVIKEVQDMNSCFYPQYPNWLKGRMTITHGDPHLENVLVNQNTLCLIDWEYTCYTIPQRDLSIFLQDLLDDELFEVAKSSYWHCLREAGWSVDDMPFQQAFYACLFDNTLMMLGWEIYKFREGHIRQTELASILSVKLRWLCESFTHLFQ